MRTSGERLGGKHVVVTGAGTGIGRAIALRVAREGASVTLLARQRDRLEATAASASVEGPVASSGSGQIALTWTPAGASSDAMREPPRRMSQPEDIAGTVAWLLSPDARGVTGQAIDQNGGAWVG